MLHRQPLLVDRMVIARAFLLGAPSEVVIARNARARPRQRDDRLDELMLPADRRTPERAVHAVKGRIAEGSVLEPPEVRQNIGVAPPALPDCRPVDRNPRAGREWR